ncbi:golgin subfamily A member 7B-like [Sycon ciliatum]|uniref:golgin subfamily A member 7B-like n=1 Tax=Sycon ciliatum TaxID=27933 RepID=UPI0031F71587|eukprot:scpid76061/ scgid4798/ Golgin subfamily A member 7B
MAARSEVPQLPRYFIQRDYSMGTVVQFDKNPPPELSGKVSQEAQHVLSDTVEHINTIFEEAEALDGAAYLEGCLACLTLCTYYVWPCVRTKYEKAMHNLAVYIENQNSTVLRQHGLRLVHPMERGLRVIEVVLLQS